MTSRNPLTEDLEQVLLQTQPAWEELRGQRLLITGGTGFFGRWLLESFAWANTRLKLDAQVWVLSRNPCGFQNRAPHLATDSAIHFFTGDVRDFDFPTGNFSHVIHAATEASAKLNTEQPLLMFDTIVTGTRRVLEFARQCGARKLLLTSSGAVYGRQPAELTHVAEDYSGGPTPTNPAAAYGEGKRAAEMLCTLYHRQHGLESKIARCFAFVGPFLPLDSHFAIGNFIGDGLKGGPIQVNGDGSPFRSYLYAADLAAWLWTILFRGAPCRPYNVGSSGAIDIRATAQLVADTFSPALPVQVAKPRAAGVLPERYVPSTVRAQQELGLSETVDLQEGIRRTVGYYRSRQAEPASKQ